jgi:hypothetical protein
VVCGNPRLLRARLLLAEATGLGEVEIETRCDDLKLVWKETHFNQLHRVWNYLIEKHFPIAPPAAAGKRAQLLREGSVYASQQHVMS